MSGRRFAVGDLVEFDLAEDALAPSDVASAFEHKTFRFRGRVADVEEHEDAEDRVRVSFGWRVPGGTSGQASFLVGADELKRKRS